MKHDVIAFTTAVAEKIGPEARWLHYGLTSNDVVDTAQALQIKAASALLREGILALTRGAEAARAWSSSTRPSSAARTASTPSPPPSG